MPAVSGCLLLVLLAAAAGHPVAAVAPVVEDEQHQLLIALADAAPGKLIPLTSEAFEAVAFNKGRAYQLIVFCLAEHLLDSPKVQLRQLRSEFELVASAYARSSEPHSVFFVELSFANSGQLFERLGINSLPFAFRWSQTMSAKQGKKITIPKDERCGGGIQAYPWPAEEIAKFVQARTRVAPASIERPSILKSPFFPLLATGALTAGGAIAWKVLHSPYARFKPLWATGTLAVFWFGVSGGMYNIIRGVPLFMYDKSGKLKYWLEGRQGQLGAEGFIMGASYLVFSGMAAVLVYGAPKIKNGAARNVLSCALAVLLPLLVIQILAAHRQKTGMSMRSFLFA